MVLPSLDPDLLRAFVAVADNRSVTRAAATLNRTQSAVSMQVKRLEERLGRSLFYRVGNRMELSAAGEKFVSYARRILALGEEAVAHMIEHDPDEQVRIGVMADYGAIRLPPLLAAFAKKHPRVHVEMTTGLTATMSKGLGNLFDLAIIMQPEGTREGELLCREQPVWAAAVDHAPERKDPLPLALYPRPCLFRQWGLAALDGARRKWRLDFVSADPEAVVGVAAQGHTVTIVKSGLFPNRLRRVDTCAGLPVLPGADIRLHRAAHVSRPAALLADHIVSCFGAQPAAH